MRKMKVFIFFFSYEKTFVDVSRGQTHFTPLTFTLILLRRTRETCLSVSLKVFNYTFKAIYSNIRKISAHL